MIEKTNNFPYIIACGPSEEEVAQYFLEIEKHVIPVRE